MRITFTAEPCEADTAFLHQQIKDLNDDRSIYHRQVRASGAVPLALFIRDEHEQIMGGLVASTYWSWLDIDDLWLAAHLRGKGLGTELMNRAESEAIRRGCTRAQVKTFAFQARDFYVKIGYSVVGKMDEYPPGHALYWLCKPLPTGSTPQSSKQA